ncbi:hypothetical protein QQZ08_000447 [Neonectria magnoliae]|uniref:B30.2/SPRY domain-containing protein n=1 Tax=Neonectria magnoliae TaxID=2732573 RepID=A0ABR1IK07_9HYPO
MEFDKHTLGFSDLHQRVHAATKGDMDQWLSFSTFKIKGKEAITRDIFGWTPLHYAGFAPPDPALDYLLDAVEGDLPIHKIFNMFKQTPVHIAASSGMKAALRMILGLLNDEDKNAMNMCGDDRMTLLHLATKIGSKDCVDYIIETSANETQLVTEVDVWGREAIHIAASCGHVDVAKTLLKAGSRPDALDEIGNSPVDYVLKGDQDLKDDQDPSLDQGSRNEQTSRSGQHSDDDAPPMENEDSADGDKTNKPQEDAIRAESKWRIFLELALKKPDYHDEDGRTFLHRAAQATDYDTISKLLYEKHDIDARGLEGRTPLHYAILAGRTKIALSLIDGINGIKANVSLKDKMGTTTLMFSTQCSLVPVITQVLKDNIEVTKDTDNNGWAALHHAVQTADCKIVELMIEKGCDPETKNSKGRTALHMTLDNEHEDIAMSGHAGVIRTILEKWPEIINDPDPQYDGTPLFCACQFRQKKAVQILLEYKELDVNKAATKLGNNTPLHLAVFARDKDMLGWITEKDTVDLNAKNSQNQTALQMAVKWRLPNFAATLLLHKATLDNVRIVHLKLCASSYPGFRDIIPDVLASIKAEFFSDDDLVELLEVITRRGTPELAERYLELAWKRNVWKRTKLLYHLAARAGSLKVIRLLTKQGANPAELDEDNWSCVDYASSYGHEEILDELLDFVRQHSEQRTTGPLHAVPTSLELGDFKDSIVGGPCSNSGHGGCKANCTLKMSDYYKSATGSYLSTFFVDIRVQAARERMLRICLRSKNCILLPTTSTKHFYFEVTVLENSESRILGLGFCDDEAPMDRMPGWFEGSWGYHGDDGNFFMEHGRGSAPTPDFGPSAAYSAGDIAGVGMNLETGEGFCTLNGKRRDVGAAFETRKFKFGKLYPCVGISVDEEGVGLHFITNFDDSDDHPFKYPGPFM